MKIQIYGSGCDKCKKLAANAEAAIQSTGLSAEIEKVTDINAITDAGVMMTPAMGIDGKIVSTGKVLSPDEIAKYLKGDASTATVSTSAKTENEPGCCRDKTASASCCTGGTESASCCAGGAKGNGKKILTILLLVLVVFSIIAMVAREMKSSKTDGAESGMNIENSAVPVSKDTVVVYYFHGNQRCMTCNKIEELTKQAISGKYSAQIADGKVVMRSVNVESSENEHFIKDFQLSIRSVVMQKDGKYEKFDDVWSLVGEPDKFATYIQNGVDKLRK